jgi:hypothetical protein
VILTAPEIDRDELARRTGWTMTSQGACKGEVCVPLAAGTVVGDRVDAAAFAERLQMPLVHDEANGLWAMGPESGGRALTTAVAPDLVLPDRSGRPFALSSLRGQKVLLVAWASW